MLTVRSVLNRLLDCSLKFRTDLLDLSRRYVILVPSTEFEHDIIPAF